MIAGYELALFSLCDLKSRFGPLKACFCKYFMYFYIYKPLKFADSNFTGWFLIDYG